MATRTVNKLTIKSNLLGEHDLVYDDVDNGLVMSCNWYPIRDPKNGRIYCMTWDAIRKKNVSIHRLIHPNFKIVDHINGNGLDNTRANLRNATHEQNMMNRISARGYKGISLKGKRYQVRIRVKGKIIFGGCFDNQRDGLLRYNELAKAHFGEFACLNQV